MTSEMKDRSSANRCVYANKYLERLYQSLGVTMELYTFHWHSGDIFGSEGIFPGPHKLKGLLENWFQCLV